MNDKYNQGYKAEKYVKKYFESQGFKVVTVGGYYDCEISKNGKSRKIEIKSCHLVVNIKNTKNDSICGKSYLGYGRMNFTNPKNTRLQKKNNVDICFVVCVGNSFEIIGLIKAKTLNMTTNLLSLKQLFNKRLQRVNSYIARFDSDYVHKGSL